MDNQLHMGKFEQRSWLRRRDKWRLKTALADGHVRAFEKSFPPNKRGMWTCPKCSTEIAERLRPRDLDGRLKKHCGCRNFISASPIPRHYRPGIREKRIAYKRAMRISSAQAEGRQLGVCKAHLCIAHVTCWKRHQRKTRSDLRKLESMEKAIRYRNDPALLRYEKFNKSSRELSDGYVMRMLRKNMPLLKGVKLPQSLIDLKRVHLMIVREVRKQEIDDGKL